MPEKEIIQLLREPVVQRFAKRPFRNTFVAELLPLSPAPRPFPPAMPVFDDLHVILQVIILVAGNGLETRLTFITKIKWSEVRHVLWLRPRNRSVLLNTLSSQSPPLNNSMAASLLLLSCQHGSLSLTAFDNRTA